MQKVMVTHSTHDDKSYTGSCPDINRYTKLYSIIEVFELIRKAKKNGNYTLEVSDDRISINFWDNTEVYELQ